MAPEVPEKLPRDEAMARTVHCSVCNAPPTVRCQRIVWPNNGKIPRVEPREGYHAHRLKAATLVARVKERLNHGR